VGGRVGCGGSLELFGREDNPGRRELHDVSEILTRGGFVKECPRRVLLFRRFPVYLIPGFPRVISRVFYRTELLFFVRPYEFLTM
jgi:hypothetical protein